MPHALAAGALVQRLETAATGLSPEIARERLRQYGPNRLSERRGHGPFLRFLLQFHNVLIYILLAAAGITALLGHWVDTGVIVGVVVINAIVGFLQEGKAEKALAAIRRMLSVKAVVLRAGRQLTIPAEELVPGDVVRVQSGDRVPADLRLLRVKNLRLDEASLTGESLPVEKQVEPVDAQAPLGDRSCMAYSGTFVTYGQGSGVVVATGDATELGRISELLSEVEQLETPLLRKIASFGRWLSVVILVIAALTFVLGTLLRGYPPVEMFMAAVGLAVAAIPEGLPAIITITLAIGVQRMARRNAIVRVLPAVEALGSVTVICSDKTGTLTRNEMTVQSLATGTHLYETSGVGYQPHGQFLRDGQPVEPAAPPELIELVRAGLLCNDAALRSHEGQWLIDGDPTEGALVVAAAKAGLERSLENEMLPRTDVIPFESEHRFMATLHHDHAGHGFVYLKGAPERVLDMCTHVRVAGEDRPLRHSDWHARIERMAARGQRVLALAFRAATPGRRELGFDDVAEGLTLLGLIGMIDPPREEAIRAVAACRTAGIRVKMITGDHAVTAAAVAAPLGIGEVADAASLPRDPRLVPIGEVADATDHMAGRTSEASRASVTSRDPRLAPIGDGKRVLTGAEIERMDDAVLRATVANVDVYARVSPEHKLRLVQALQANGEIVAMTGDGVNDAPALKRADIGVAMGVTGTEVAKEAADIVLADDNFASIVNAVEEGRTIYDNLRKTLLFMMPTNAGEAFTLIVAIALGLVLPILPVQILWVNMVTAVTLALALAFDPTEPDTMRRPPRDPRAPIFSRYFLWRTLLVTAVVVAGTLGMFLWEQSRGESVEAARTAAVNTLVMFEAVYLLNTRFLLAPSWPWRALAGNPWVPASIVLVLGLQLLYTYAPFMQALFHSAPLDAGAWGRIVLIALTVYLVVEIEKALVRAAGWKVL